MPTERPAGLTGFFAGSLLLHAIVWLLWPASPQPGKAPIEVGLTVVLPPASPAPTRPIVRTVTSAAGQTGSRRVLPDISITGKASPAPMETADIPAAPVVANLLEQAKATLDKESRQRMLDPMFSSPSKTAVADSPLARATNRPPAGEKRLGDNVLQVTTADGKVHCLLKPSEIASRDIPGGTFATPVNCPLSF